MHLKLRKYWAGNSTGITWHFNNTPEKKTAYLVQAGCCITDTWPIRKPITVSAALQLATLLKAKCRILVIPRHDVNARTALVHASLMQSL